MLVTRRGSRLACVNQYDHGAVAGALAECWGDGRFEPARPPAALVRAAAHHDDGWHALDDVPFVDRDAVRPAHFTEVPSPMTIAAYGIGVEALYAEDPHAGVLVSMHWSGLFCARWGLQDGGPTDSAAGRATAREQERRWRETALELWGYRGPRSEFEARLWHAYEVLQALDLLSLLLCLVDVGRPTDLSAPPAPVQATLREIDQRPGPRVVGAVPTGPGGEHVALTAAVLAPGVVSLVPFPFAGDAVEVEIPTRLLARTTYGSAALAADAYHAAPVTPARCAIIADPPPARNAHG